MDDLEQMTRDQLTAEVVKLRNAIRAFLTKEGQDWCWENYNELGQILPEKLLPQPPRVCPLDAMDGCVRYWKMIAAVKTTTSGKH